MKKQLLAIGLTIGVLGAVPLQAQDGEALFKSKPCVACHQVDGKMVGPALKEIGAKYAGQEGAVEMLATSIKNGVSGKWGPMAMPPNPVTEEEARLLAEWVLSLNEK
ncbi:c-type cytochrome [Microbulbifer yueqingensis]|uniref:Cytochrome c-551 n=1 Tax=Microbulbifer yueqingensis TaxID=658219 RepID=A0A1G9ELC7_9GAMM|nr:c-type cytochrome [Microbulbifer yueqingensis]SDK76883.1 cytochrome c [Microbulbifer yueqingensis]